MDVWWSIPWNCSLQLALWKNLNIIRMNDINFQAIEYLGLIESSRRNIDFNFSTQPFFLPMTSLVIFRWLFHVHCVYPDYRRLAFSSYSLLFSYFRFLSIFVHLYWFIHGNLAHVCISIGGPNASKNEKLLCIVHVHICENKEKVEKWLFYMIRI